VTDLDATILRLDADLHRACLMQARLIRASPFIRALVPESGCREESGLHEACPVQVRVEAENRGVEVGHSFLPASTYAS
jgi:hypothetical protein